MAVGLLSHQPAALSRAIVEEVYLASIETNADRAVIVRASGETYVVEKGAGCASLWRYQGSGVLVISPGQFLGFGARLLIPDASQQCSIWKAPRIHGRSRPWVDAIGFGD
jgi:hypothetical protein